MGTTIVSLLLYLITLAFVGYLLYSDRGDKEPVWALAMAVGLGLVAGELAGLLNHFLLPEAAIKQLLLNHNTIGFATKLGLTAGIVEESLKFIPLAVIIYNRRYFNEHTDGVLYFALVGLTFGLIENLIYTRIFGPSIGIVRMITLLFFHAATTGITGYFLAKSKVDRNPLLTPILVFIGMVIAHALFDFSLAANEPILLLYSISATTLLNVGLFLFYMRANELDRSMGLSSSGKNKFCRHCGKPNPNTNLYCNYCGKIA